MIKRINIVIDETLLNEAKIATGLKTNTAVVDFALKELLRYYNQKRILELRGRVKWGGNLEKMRLARGKVLRSASPSTALLLQFA